jgi:hypothetical protein
MMGKNNIKALVVIILIFLQWGCSNLSNNEMADNALDGGRYFLESCNQGDFKKANYYLLEGSENQSLLKDISTDYFALDKEGRQQLRQASIQINEIKALDNHQTIINYQSSLDKVPHQIKVINTPSGWKVDLKYSNTDK